MLKVNARESAISKDQRSASYTKLKAYLSLME